ncbi:cytochrome P450 [Burkholderia metallica]|uniref:cytochrome P450 n=1 Tax=Burkholderia metallica TaxID=488729 RepID=UPI0015756B9A|nr:cytochrome P450 [Burkholderia metallica]NTZ05501.1 cytochrome P450 [Burkholderia metallica]
MHGAEFDPRVFEHNDAAFFADPYPFYAYMRQHMHRYRAEHLFGGAWLMFGYHDIRELLQDPRLSTSRARLPIAGLPKAAWDEFEDMFSFFDGWIAFNEFHQHLKMRRQAHQAMALLMPTQLRPRVRRITNTLLRGRQDRDRLDVMTELATPLPALVLAELLGVPYADSVRLKAWSDDISRLYGSTNLPLDEIRRIRTSALALLAYLDDLAAHSDARGTLLGDLMNIEVDAYRPDRREAIAQVVMLLFAAIEPTAYLVGNAIAALQNHPEQLARLHQNLDLVGALVEETLRYDTPVQFVGRLVREDFLWNGCQMREGQVVLGYVASAHRDSTHYHDPDRFELGRSDARNLAFGCGTHYCLGAPTVRVVAEEALGAILRHFPSLTRTDTPATFNTNLGFRGRTSLVVKRVRAPHTGSERARSEV